MFLEGGGRRFEWLISNPKIAINASSDANTIESSFHH